MSSNNHAVVVSPEAQGRLAIRGVAEPVPDRAEALVRVRAISLNRGEVRRAGMAAAGWRPGWDLAGEVERAAADGSGPRVGARVVGLLPEGAWAERVAVPTHALAELPEKVTFSQAGRSWAAACSSRARQAVSATSRCSSRGSPARA